MKIPSNFIEGCTPAKDVRHYLLGIHYDAASGRLAASDGGVAVVIPATCEDGDGKTDCFIPSAAIKEARRLKADKMQVNGKITIAAPEGGKREMPVPEGAIPPGTFNRLVDVIPERGEFDRVLSIDAALLLKLAKAVNDDPKKAYVCLYVPEDTSRAIRVEPDSGDAVGVIMPLMPLT